MPCEEKRKLVSAYGVAVQRYSITVKDLDLTRGKITRQEYQNLFTLSEQARLEARKAHGALERHARNQGC